MNATLFDMLGIDQSVADRVTAAKAIWPANLISLTQGMHTGDDTVTVLTNLQSGLTFTNVRPGVDPSASFKQNETDVLPTFGQIAISADMAVSGALATAQPFYLASMPDIGIQLKATDPVHPARITCASDGRGFEIIIEKLPVAIFLKEGTATALSGAPLTVGDFDPTAIDSYSYTLNTETEPAEIDVFVRLHLTTSGDVILEPAVPISFGPCRWLGLPAKAVYDILLIPSPNRRDYFEWSHNDLGAFISNPPVKGALGFRSIDLDFTQSPLADLAKRLQNGAVNLGNLEMVMEDVVIPLYGDLGPIPSHGTFGFRRKITDRNDIAQAYSFANAPLQIPIYSSGAQGGNGGSSWMLEVDNFFFQTGDPNAVDPSDQPQVQFSATFLYQSASGNKVGAQVGVDADWLVNAGIALDPTQTPVKMTIAGTDIGAVGAKFGISVTRLAQGMKFTDSFELLADLFVAAEKPAGGSSSGDGKTSAFQITSLTGKPLQVVIHDIGWKLGNLSLDALQMPNGVQLIFAGYIHIIIEELGYVEEPNGTPYFSFSGGISLGSSGGNATAPSTNTKDDSNGGYGVRVRRLRFRLNDDGSQPFLKLDGIFMNLSYGSVVSVSGFGYISDYVDTGWHVSEWGFGVDVKINTHSIKFEVAGEFVKGSRQNLSDPTQEFGYFLASVMLSYMPAGPFALYDIRALVADNMAPNLDSTYPDGEGMALLKWHQNHDSALNFPANRTLADWIPEDGAFSIGIGTGFSINGVGAGLNIAVFIFFSKSKADEGILIVGELHLLQNPKPIAFVAIEYDISSGKFGVMAGVNLTLSDFAKSLPDWLAHIASLSGTIYVGNEPWTFAIGQLADQSSWLQLKINFDVWVMVFKAMFGLCIQIVDGGPKGFALVFQIEASASWGIGQFILFGSFGLIIGMWKTGSDSSGIEFWVQAGFKINLFFVFSFGAEIGMKITYLGKSPWYITLHAEVKIDTPWFLPDVTFSFDKTWQSPQPFDTSTLTQGLSKASGIDPTQRIDQPLLVPGLTDGVNNASTVYTFNSLNGLAGVRIDDTTGVDVPLVSVDATIAINFTQPMSNDSAIATSTYGGTTDTGVQQVQDITARYALQSIAIRRAPRFGPTAGQWSDFVTDAQTQFSVGGAAPEYLTFAWDTDARADGKLSPNRLLVNSSSPYSFITSSPQNDEQALANDRDFPCCSGEDRRHRPVLHYLAFDSLPSGSRAPAHEQFSGPKGAWWNWDMAPAPAVGFAIPSEPGVPCARFMPRASQLCGHADFNEVASAVNLDAVWDALPGTLFFEGYNGLNLVAQQSVSLKIAGSTTLSLILAGDAALAGLTRVTLRVQIDPAAAFADPATFFATGGSSGLAGIGIVDITYLTVAEARAYLTGEQNCGSNANLGPPGSDASGKLAFLPNHDYEVVVSTSIDLGTASQSSRRLTLGEALYFRTKGLPGLNACANVGDDIRPHVDTTYPLRCAIPLYRTEPCVLAFENSLSSVLPIDRTPGPSDPPEKAQQFPLELNIDRVVSQSGLQRLTMPSGDWIAAHRPHLIPPHVYASVPAFAISKTRVGLSHDPLVQRFEAVKTAAAASCGTPGLDHASQVLLHEPIAADGSANPWEATTGYRATVRQAGGPFTEVTGFDADDAAAFISQADGSAAAAAWSADGAGNMVAPVTHGGRAYASCGDPDWDHLQAHARIDLRHATAAGIAVGVGSGTPVSQAIVATIETASAGHALVVRAVTSGGQSELGRATIVLNGPALLTVIAYDDVVRASVGTVSIDAPRNAIREGRVALVAEGAAAFAGIAVGALDMFSFEFITSRYATFAEHIGSYDGSLPVLAAGAFGDTPSPIAAVMAANAAAIPALMQGAADPQARQKLFDGMVNALGVGLRKATLNVTLSRLTDASGTFGLLLQSPEPVSLVRDVTLTLTQRVTKWVPPPIIPHRPVAKPPLTLAGVSAAALTAHAQPLAGTPPSSPSSPPPPSLTALEFTQETVTAPAGRITAGPGDRIVRIVDTNGTSQLQVFEAPTAPRTGGPAVGALLETVPLAQALKRASLAQAATLTTGSIAVIQKHGILGPILQGHWETVDVPVAILPLSNGAETSVLILTPGVAHLGSGTYRLTAVLDRDRWNASTEADPEQHYHDSQTLTLTW